MGLRSKRVETVLGPIQFRRSLFVCPECGKSCFPGDQLLGIEGTCYSPGAKRMIARAGSRTSFVEAEEDLRVYAQLEVGCKQVERIAEEVGAAIEQWDKQRRSEAVQAEAKPTPRRGETPRTRESEIPTMYVSFDGTGIPMRRQEVEGRRGKQADGSAKTREVKLGCVFTQTCVDDEGRPVRDPNTTTYVGAIEDSETFGERIYGEAVARGLERAKRLVALTDGAAYNKSILEMHFPEALWVIDLYHAREHLNNLGKLLLPEGEKPEGKHPWAKLLDQGEIDRLLQEATKKLPRSGERKRKALTEMNYFRENAPRMRYGHFRAQGIFVGSGVIEAGCRTLVAQRLKQSGMFWSVAGANAIIAARCCLYSNRYEQYWEDRLPAA